MNKGLLSLAGVTLAMAALAFEDAVEWFHRVVAVDSEELTDARERLSGLEDTEGTDTVERGEG